MHGAAAAAWLHRYGEPTAPAACRRHVLRYCEFAIDELGCTEAVLHNLLVALHCLDTDGERARKPHILHGHHHGRGRRSSLWASHVSCLIQLGGNTFI